MRTFLLRLRDDLRGASVIEFAMFAPILAMMVMGISDFAMGYAMKLRVEQGVYRALEKVAVGSVQTDYQFLKADAANEAGVAQTAVTVDNWLECNRVRQTDFAGMCATGEDTARYVSVSISTAYTPQFNYGPLIRGTDGTVPISASSSLRIQ